MFAIGVSTICLLPIFICTSTAYKDLDDILRQTGSDKAKPNKNGGYHGYTRYYERFFNLIQ